MPQWEENVTLMSPALGWEEWQTSAVTLLHRGECLRAGLGRHTGPTLTDRSQIKLTLISHLGPINILLNIK